MFDVEKNKLRVAIEVGGHKSLYYQFVDLDDGSFGGDLPKDLKGLNEVNVFVYQGDVRKDFQFFEYFPEGGGTLTKLPNPILKKVKNLVLNLDENLDLPENKMFAELTKDQVSEEAAKRGAELIDSFKNIEVKYYRESSIQEKEDQVFNMKYEGFKNELQNEVSPGGTLVLEVPGEKVVTINNFDGSKKLPKSVQDLVMKDYIDNMQSLLMNASNAQRQASTIIVGGVKLK